VTTVFTSVEKFNIPPYHPIRRKAIRRAENVFEVRETGETSEILRRISLVSPARIRRSDFFLIFRSSEYIFPANMKQRGINHD